MPAVSRKRTRIGFYGYAQSERTPRLLAGVLEYRQKHKGVDLYHFLIDVMTEFENEVWPPWKDHVDGVLISTSFGGPVDDTVDWLRGGGVPTVTMVSNIIDPRLPVVIVDPESTVRLSLRELTRCGCQRLMFLGFRPSVGSALRAEVWERMAKENGLPFARLDSDWNFADGVTTDADEDREIAALLTADPRPVGVHTLNEVNGRRVMRICEEQGLRVPQDVAIVTEDDSAMAFEHRPTLSSVCYPGEQVAYRATQLLAELIAGRRPPRKPVLVPVKKIARRETTGGAHETDDVARALEVIRRKATLGLKVQDLVDSLQVNRRTLERAFREQLGRSPAFEIQRLKMAAARELLKETKFSIGHIGALVGYAEQAAFTNAFHRDSGFAPKEFRRQPQLGNARRKEK